LRIGLRELPALLLTAPLSTLVFLATLLSLPTTLLPGALPALLLPTLLRTTLLLAALLLAALLLAALLIAILFHASISPSVSRKFDA
jgi:hypothetical protein